MQDNIAIIGGSGLLPSILIDHLKEKYNRRVFVVGVKNNIDTQILHDVDHIIVSLGEIQKVIDYLKSNSVKNIIFAGGIKKPSLLSMKLDKKGMKFLGKIGLKVLSGGDDHLLKIVIRLFEDEGFSVKSIQDIAPLLLSPKGVMGKHVPSASDYKDITVGDNVLMKMGDLDVGQSVIVENSTVLGIEAAEGTDALIDRCSLLKKEKDKIGVLVKRKKISQDIRVDLPTIGIKTIESVYESGFKGIAVGAGESLIINKESVINFANKHKLFLIGI